MKIRLTIATLLISIIASGQGSIRRANAYYYNFSYYKVVELLHNKANLSTASLRQLADSYRKTGNYRQSEITYAKIVAAPDKTPDDIYAYAQILKMNRNYPEAQVQMDQFAALKPEDSRSKLFLKQRDYANDLLLDKGQFRIKTIGMNSPQQDFGAAYYKDRVVFASTHHDIGLAYRQWNGNNLPFLDLYSGKPDSTGEISDLKQFKAFNKKYHDGPASFSKDGNSMFFSRNNYQAKSKDGTRETELVEARFTNGEWKEATPFPYNSKEYALIHPSLSADGMTLYFASDMPGGLGGTDIYKVTRNADGSWSRPENMGNAINTEGNEFFPCIHESGLFFFASDGRPGLGGLDVFVTQLKDGRISKVINVGSPVNGSKDDFGLTLNADKTMGYFTSNREGGKGQDDLYAFQLLKPFRFGKTIKGVITDKLNNPLANATVELYDPFDGIGKALMTVTSAEDGSYSMEVDEANDYLLIAKKEQYFDSKSSVDVNENDEVVISDLVLEKNPGFSLYFLITDAETKKALEGVKITITEMRNTEPVDFQQTPATGDYLKPLPGRSIGDRLTYKIRLQKRGYLTKEVALVHVIKQAGRINVHESLNLSMDPIDVGDDIAKLIEIKPIYFDLGKYTIRKDAALELDKIIKVMNENPEMVIELGSHTDCRGNKTSNEALSDKRAKASAAYIRQQITNPERIYGKGYGETRPVNGCVCEGAVKSTCTEEEHQKNRRTEFIIISL